MASAMMNVMASPMPPMLSLTAQTKSIHDGFESIDKSPGTLSRFLQAGWGAFQTISLGDTSALNFLDTAGAFVVGLTINGQPVSRKTQGFSQAITNLTEALHYLHDNSRKKEKISKYWLDLCLLRLRHPEKMYLDAS